MDRNSPPNYIEDTKKSLEDTESFILHVKSLQSANNNNNEHLRTSNDYNQELRTLRNEIGSKWTKEEALNRLNQLWKEMEDKNIRFGGSVFTLAIQIYTELGDSHSATKLYHAMKLAGFEEDLKIYNCLVKVNQPNKQSNKQKKTNKKTNTN